MKFKWTDADVAQWANWYAQGMHLYEIGKKSGASVPTISARLTKSGIALRSPSRNAKNVFDTKWTPEPNTGCWLWTGGTQKTGYGFFRYSGEVLAHRASFIIHKGPIPADLNVLHHCDVPQCVNPDHLFVGTQLDNMQDCAKKGRVQRTNAKKTHCPRGHEYTGDNVQPLPNGGRGCRACNRLKAMKHRNNNLEAARARDRRSYWAKKEQTNA